MEASEETLHRHASRLLASSPQEALRVLVTALRRDAAANGNAQRLEKRLAETQAQLLASIEEKQALIDRALIASQDKTRALRELRRMDGERRALRASLADLRLVGGGVIASQEVGVAKTYGEVALFRRMQAELEQLQKQMDSARGLVEENARLSGRCERLEEELEAMKRNVAGGRRTRKYGGEKEEEEEAVMAVRHMTQNGKVALQSDLYVVDVCPLADNRDCSLIAGDRILEINGMKTKELTSSHVQGIFDSSREVLVKVSRMVVSPQQSIIVNENKESSPPLNQVMNPPPYVTTKVPKSRGKVFSTDGLVGSKGGLLHIPETSVTLVVTDGALSDPYHVYLAAKYDGEAFPLPKDEFVASPEVGCIPAEEQKFEEMAELKVPHCVATEMSDWSLRVLRGTASGRMGIQWTEIASLNQNRLQSGACRLGHDHVNISVEGASTYVIVGRPIRMQVTTFVQSMTNDWPMRLRILPDLKAVIRDVQMKEENLGYEALASKTFSFYKVEEDVAVTLFSKTEAWHVRAPLTKVVSWQETVSVGKPFPSLDFVLLCDCFPFPRLSARIVIQQGDQTLLQTKIVKRAATHQNIALEETLKTVSPMNFVTKRRLSVPSILSLSVVSQLATYLDPEIGRKNWRALAKALRLSRRLVKEFEATSEYQSATEQVLRAWKPEAGTDVRCLLWKILTELGRNDAARVVIPPEELETIRRLEECPDIVHLDAGSGDLYPRLTGSANGDTGRDSDNDSTEVNFDGKSEPENSVLMAQRRDGGTLSRNKEKLQRETYL